MPRIITAQVKSNKKEIVDYIVNGTGLKGQDAEILKGYLYQRMQTLRKDYNKRFIDKLIKDKPRSYDKPDFIKKVMELINTGALQNDNI